MKIYNKLVRDNIPNIIKNDNKIPNIKILDDDEFIDCLNSKLLEEVNEYLDDYDIAEIADILEVLYAILNAKGISIEQINEIRNEKNEKNGAFTKKIFLNSVK